MNFQYFRRTVDAELNTRGISKHANFPVDNYKLANSISQKYRINTVAEEELVLNILNLTIIGFDCCDVLIVKVPAK